MPRVQRQLVPPPGPLMRWLKDFYRFRIQRLYWITIQHDDGTIHRYPNRDLIRHELTGCPCGPADLLAHDETGSDVWLTDHHSLDAREGRER